MILASGGFKALAPQAFSETEPQFFSSYFMPRIGLEMATDFVTYGVMYQTQSNVFACVDKIANLVARLDRSVIDVTDPDRETVDTKGPLARLIKSPCITLDPYTLWHWLITTYEVYGEAFLIKQRDGDGVLTRHSSGKAVRKYENNAPIISLIPMHPATTAIYRDELGDLMYSFQGIPDQLFPETDIVALKRYNPFNTMRGMSRLEPLRLTLINEHGARRAQIAWWENMCRPSMVLQTPKKLGDNGRERLYAAVSASQSGAENSGGTLVLEDEVTATRMQLGAEELQYIQSRMFNREEVCSAYDLAPQLVQFMSMGDVGIASYQAISKDAYKFSISPRVNVIESCINYAVSSEPSMGSGTRAFKFNMATQLRGDIELLAPAAVQLVQSGIAKPGEMREWFELPDGGDEVDQFYANSALEPLAAMIDKAKAPQHLPSIGANNQHPVASMGDLPQHVPQATSKSDNYVRAIKGAMGKGDNVIALIHKWSCDRPDDVNDIETALVHVAYQMKGIEGQ